MRAFTCCLLVVLATAVVADPIYLPQNWTEDQRQWFYTTPQGSKLVRYEWAIALERPDSTDLFFADDLARYGYLPNKKGKWNPDGLPVGFVKDTGSKNYLGLTCSACHTNEIDYKGTTFRIDGAPANSEVFGFLAELSESLTATTKSVTDEKFLRFAKRVLGEKDNVVRRALLYPEVRKAAKDFAGFITDSVPTSPWGRARADAFGMIFNRVSSIDLKIPSNSRKPDAPVSYPFLWDTSWHNVVQWNGSAPNQFAILRLARNVGEVLGVFADIDIKTPHLLHWYYKSTAKRLNLLWMEEQLSTLHSPRWPSQFPAIDAAKAARGKAIYEERCLKCHIIAIPETHQTVTMTPLDEVGTDDAMAKDAAVRVPTPKTGVLDGVPQFVILGKPLGPTAEAGTITFNTIVGAILSPHIEIEGPPPPPRATAAPTVRSQETDNEGDLKTRLQSARHQQQSSTHAQNETTSDPLQGSLREALASLSPPSGLAYKARPLDGIWATAPYLHNGSVPTLRDLLTPPASRPKTFYVGSREFDPVNVGFDTSQGADRSLFDTSKRGNSNAGHDYGMSPPWSTEDRDALIEYLKSL